MYLSLIFLPLMLSLFMLLFGRAVGQRGAFLLVYAFFSIAVLFILIMFVEVSLYHSFCIVDLFLD